MNNIASSQSTSTFKREGCNDECTLYDSNTDSRTLAISVFGEMDVSSIKQLPKGRKPIITNWAKHEQYEQVLSQNDV